MLRALQRLSLAAVAALALAGCGEQPFSEEDKALIASLSLAELPPLPAAPSNRVADLPRAAALGATLFFETRLSRDGSVACATCHLPDRQFQDDLPLGKGIGTTARRTMPLSGVAWSPWQFWDGRRDSLWAQALAPLEDPAEHGGTRTAYAHLLAEHYRARYEGIFGPMPRLAHLPASAGPFGTEEEKAAWAAMNEAGRQAVDTIFANMGKAIAAFERSLAPTETRFDRFAAALAADEEPAADAVLSEQEIAGLKLFIGEASCVNCHNGPRFTDDFFHNTGVPGEPDRGRAGAVGQVLADPFNCLGPHSDAAADKCAELRFMLREGEELERAFKTPSLRGAAARPPYMHAGQIATLEDVLDHYSTAPAAPAGHSELEPLDLTEEEKAALIAFLRSLE